MSLSCYLAMTAGEFFSILPRPNKLAWMACHFSGYGTGLSNLPRQLPQGSLILVNDRTPLSGHDPDRICRQLADLIKKHRPKGILLDLQRPVTEEAQILVQTLVSNLPGPVGVSHLYADTLDCPVFLPPPPLNKALMDHLKPWSGREIWLETATETQIITVTEAGSTTELLPLQPLPEPCFSDAKLHCRYHTQVFPHKAVFNLNREGAEVEALLREAEALGVTLAVGLYQQLRHSFPHLF